jgi:hypothetical protein
LGILRDGDSLRIALRALLGTRRPAQSLVGGHNSRRTAAGISSKGAGWVYFEDVLVRAISMLLIVMRTVPVQLDLNLHGRQKLSCVMIPQGRRRVAAWQRN